MVKIIEVISDEVEVLSVILKMMGPGGTGGSASFCVRTLATLLVLLLALQEAHAVIEERGEADVSARITPVFSPKRILLLFVFSPPICVFYSGLSSSCVEMGFGRECRACVNPVMHCRDAWLGSRLYRRGMMLWEPRRVSGVE